MCWLKPLPPPTFASAWVWSWVKKVSIFGSFLWVLCFSHLPLHTLLLFPPRAKSLVVKISFPRKKLCKQVVIGRGTQKCKIKAGVYTNLTIVFWNWMPFRSDGSCVPFQLCGFVHRRPVWWAAYRRQRVSHTLFILFLSFILFHVFQRFQTFLSNETSKVISASDAAWNGLLWEYSTQQTIPSRCILRSFICLPS